MVGQLKEDVAEWYQGLSAHMRIEAMCTLIDLSMPFEIRFLGSLIEHLGRKDFGSLREAESKANSFTNANPDEKKKLLKSLGEVSTGCMINGTQFMNPLMHPTNFNESPGNRPSPTHSSDSKGRQLSISSSEIPLQHLNDHVASSAEPCINSHDALSSKTGSSSKGGSSIASSNHIGCISSEEETESMCIANDHKRRKLILYVSVLQPTNHDCANLYYTVLSDIEDSPALAWLEELDKDAQEEVSLLYTLASRHPAFTFEQRMFLGRVATRVNEVIASKFPSRGNTATPQESAQQSHHLHNNLSSSSPASHPVYINHAPIPQAMDPKYAAATGGYYFFTTPHNYMPAPHQPSSNNGDQQQQLRNTTAVSGPYPAYGPYGPYFISHPPHHHHAQALPHPTALNPHYAQIPIQIPSSSSVVTTPTGPQHQGASNTNVNVPPPSSMVASNSNHQLGGSGVAIVSKNPNQPQQQQPPSATNSISQQSCLSTPSRTSSVPFQSEANSVDGDSAEESSENCDWNSPESSPFESPPQSLTPSRSQSPPSGIPNSTSVQAVSLSGHSATYLVTSSGSATMVSSSYGPPPPASVIVGPSLPVINNASSSNCSNSSSSASTIVNKTEINNSSSSSSVSSQGFVITTATSSSISPSSSASCTTTASSTGNSNNGHIIHNSVNNSSSNKSNTSLHNTPHSHHPPPPCSSSNSSSNSSLGARNPVKNNNGNQNNNTNQSFSIHPPAPPSGVGSSTVISVSQPPPPQQQQQQMMGPSSVPVHLQQQQNSSVVNNVGVVVSHSMSSANAPPPPLAAFAQQQQQQQNPHGAHNSLGLNTSLPPPPHQNNYHCYPGIQPTSLSFGGMNAGAAYRAPSQNVLTRSPYVQTQVANALLNNQMVIKGDVQQQQQQQQQQRGVSHSVHGSLRQKTPIQNTPKRRSNLGGANMSGMALHQNSQSTSASVGGKGDEVSDSSMKDNSNSGSNNISSGNNSRTNEIVVSANPSNNKGNQQQQQPPPQERTTGGGGGAGGVSGKNYHHVTNGIVNSNSGAGGAVLPGNPLPNSNSVVINNPPPPPQSINSSSNPGGQIMSTPNKVASEDGLLGDGGNAVLENYSAAPVNQLPYHMNGPQLYGHPPGHYIQLPNGYMTSSYYPPAMAAAAAAAAAAAMGGGPVPPSTEIMMNPAGVPHFSFPFTIPQSFSSPQQQQQQQQSTGGNKMSNNAKDSVKNNSQQQQNNQQGGSSGDNKVIDGHVGGGGLPAYNPVGPSYYTTTTTGRNPSNRNSNRGVILDIGGALGNSSLSPVNVVDLALLPPLDEIAETVHRPRKPSCYNCGASNHLGPECKEGSMEEMTRHQFRVNYSGPASVTADGKDGD